MSAVGVSPDLGAYLHVRRDEVERALLAVLPPAGSDPVALVDAMRYSVLAGGKRLRPLLVLAAAETCGASEGDLPELTLAAAALELFHTYSLIHDDLPCMDDDTLRRGRPTCHVVHGEAMALLAGDTLQTLGFEVLATHPAGAGADAAARRGLAVGLAASALGVGGMAGGQGLDLVSTRPPGEAGGGAPPPDRAALLREIHARKTGRLIAVSLELGALYAGAPDDRRLRVRRFGDELGLVFQIADDLLDVTADSKTLGKTAGKDERQHKLTYPAVYGLAGARLRLEEALDSARSAAGEAGDEKGLFSALASYAARRDR